MPSQTRENNVLTVNVMTDPRGNIVVEIADNGIGIDDEKRHHIFEPFYTTKPVGEGTGLGLSICHTMIQRYKGEIQVESKVGEGSLFRVILPPAKGGVAPCKVEKAPPSSCARKQILIIDDEKSICESVIEAFGEEHDVLACFNGVDALKLLREPQELDLILCDLMMPMMDGTELFKIIERENPSLARKFIFVTGGAVHPSTQEFIESVKNQVVHKPFHLSRLKKVIQNSGQNIS